MADDVDLKLLRVEEALRRLERLVAECGGPSAYVADRDLQSIAERNVQVAVEGLVDLGNLLGSRNRWPAPRTAADTVRTLVAHGVLARGLERPVTGWVRMRNILVHEYAVIDSNKVYRKLARQLSALRRAVRDIALALGR